MAIARKCIHLTCGLLLVLCTRTDGHTYNTKLLLLNHLRTQIDQTRYSEFGTHFKAALDHTPCDTIKTHPELLGIAGQRNVSDICIQSMEVLLSALRTKQEAALRMIDSIGKPKAGILDGALNWLGNYDECVNETIHFVLRHNVTSLSSSFHGKYCRVGIPFLKSPSPQLDLAEALGLTDFPPGSLVLGICVPDTCSQHDVLLLTKIVLENIPGNLSQHYHIEKVICQEEHIMFDEKSRAVVLLLAVLVGLLVIGTIYDVFLVQQLHLSKMPRYVEVLKDPPNRGILDEVPSEHTPILGERKYEIKKAVIEPGNLVGKLLVSFSIYTNGGKLFSTQCTSDTLTCMFGLRLITMTWIILGHAYMNECLVSDNALPYLDSLIKRWTSQVILNGAVSVDTFFVMSGFLLSFLTMKELKKVGGPVHFKWRRFYFHRFWRLTPMYYLVLLVYISVLRYVGTGPDWPQESVDENCDKYWWRNILYINNLYPAGEMCMGWSWYLANDIQFFLLSPILLIALYRSALSGVCLCLSFLVINWVSSGVISSVYDLPPNPLGGGHDMSKAIDYQNVYYYKPYCRIGPYIIGIMAGYLLFRNKGRVHICKTLNILGWLIATASCTAVVYGLYDTYNGHTDDRITAAVYNAMHRSIWAVGVSWVIIACSSGYGGPVNSVLSWKPFIPLSRLTYAVYLVHLVIINVRSWSRRTPAFLTDMEMVYAFLGHLLLSFAVALVVTLSFESPFMAMEKTLFKRNKI